MFYFITILSPFMYGKDYMIKLCKMLYKPDRTENNKNCQTAKTEWWTQDREPRARKVMSGHQQPLERQSQQSQMVLEGDKAFSPITQVSPRAVIPLRLYMGE